ncbi:prefoldin subunit alpha [Candidatus Woesearchaeota archaeon]|nr:prefoldin subunit alpha [Candidatus Woesearchaeota archaeon]
MDEKQELLVELRQLDQQIKHIQNHVENVDNQIAEFSGIKKALEDFANLKKGAEIKVPIANGIFIDAELKNVKDLLVNVGANVSVKKTVPQVKEMMEEQEHDLAAFRSNLVLQLQEMIARAEEIQEQYNS